MKTSMITYSFIALSIILLSCITSTEQSGSIHDFSITSIDGEKINLASFKGKKILIVNTASECGYTPQYKELQELHSKYGAKVIIIGVPANEFGGQEPGANPSIKQFCTKNYGVSFLMSEKQVVKGKDISPLFKWMINQPNPDFTGDINWNFEKFLFDESGKLIHRYRSGTRPLDPLITSKL